MEQAQCKGPANAHVPTVAGDGQRHVGVALTVVNGFAGRDVHVCRDLGHGHAPVDAAGVGRLVDFPVATPNTDDTRSV